MIAQAIWLYWPGAIWLAGARRVGADPEHLERLVLELLVEAHQIGRGLAARTAPRPPEIEQHGLRRLEDLLFKICVCDMNDLLAHQR